MRRKLFTSAAVISAMLCIAACVLWAVSYRRTLVIGRGRDTGAALSPDSEWGPILSAGIAICSRGEILLGSVRAPEGMFPQLLGIGWFHRTFPTDEVGIEGPGFWGRLGFVRQDVLLWGGDIRGWILPFWSIAAAAAVLPAG